MGNQLHTRDITVGGLNVRHRQITTGELSSLRTTPIELIPAPDANHFILPVAAGAYIDYVSTAYDYELVDSHQTGTATSTVGSGVTNQRHAIQFTNGAAIEIQRAEFSIKKFGTPTGNVVVKIYDDGGTTPGTEVASSGNVDISTLTASYQDISFSLVGAGTLTAATDY